MDGSSVTTLAVPSYTGTVLPGAGNGTATRLSTVARTTPAEASAPASSAADDDGSSSLSAGARAGIGIGVAAGAILIGVVVFFLVRRHRRDRSSDSKSTGSERQIGNQEVTSPVYEHEHKYDLVPKYEQAPKYDHSQTVELSEGPVVRAELEAARYASRPVGELP